jgi:hypothetical protein
LKTIAHFITSQILRYIVWSESNLI